MKSLQRIFCLFATISFIFSSPVDIREAQAVALDKYPGKVIERTVKTNDELYLTTFENGGFVLTSADDGFPAILAYSPDAPTGSNPAFDDLCSDYARQVRSLRSEDRPRHADWEKMTAGSLNKMSVTSAVPPMIGSRWNQSPYYNNKFPYFVLPGYTNKRPYVGCVAVVMGQLMNYYEHPQRGFGKRWFYSESTDSLLEAWHDTTWYDYDDMPDSLCTRTGVLTASQRELDEVSLFLYQCAVSVDMELLPDGSSSAYEDMMYALTSYFDYNTDMIQEEKGAYNETDWKQKIVAELTAGRPIPYRGSGDSGGHAFLLDGYETTTNTYYHFNWGWGGYYDGWFLLSALNPAEGYDYTQGQAAVFNIQPNPDDLTRYAYTGFEGYQAGWIYSGSNFYSLTGEEDLVYGFSQNGQWLISPKIHIPNHDNVTFLIYAQQINSGTKECRVMISDSDTMRTSFTSEVGRITPGAGWTAYMFSLRSYKNSDVYIGIQYLSPSGYIIIDDLSIWTPKVVVETDEIVPQKHQLMAAYPNPFNPGTTIAYSLANDANVELTVFDLRGNRIQTLINKQQHTGNYQLLWNAAHLSSGIYLCTLTVDDQRIDTQKLLLVK